MAEFILTGSWDHTARLWDAATGQPLGPPLQHRGRVWTVAFSPDGRSFLTGAGDGKARLFCMPDELPDDVELVATGMEILTGLRLQTEQGSIQALDNAAWRELRGRLMQLGGAPETGGAERLDPILYGPDPTARARVWMERGQWDVAEAAYAELVRAGPCNAAICLESGRFPIPRGRPEMSDDDVEGKRSGSNCVAAKEKKVLGISCGSRRRNAHEIAKCRWGLAMNDHELLSTSRGISAPAESADR
jgi:hypothetical protein